MSSEDTRRCYQCDKPDTEAIILTISLPPTIIKQDLCPDCLKQAIDNSKKLGKAAQ